MWSVLDQTDLFLITANATIKRNGALVMGRGLAREARDRVPGLDLDAGRLIQRIQTSTQLGGRYGLAILRAPYGLFQVKFHYRNTARPDLISLSVSMLKRLLWAHSDWRVDLNFPGIGNGKLDYLSVLPLVSVLPDTVHIWRKERTG